MKVKQNIMLATYIGIGTLKKDFVFRRSSEEDRQMYIWPDIYWTLRFSGIVFQRPQIFRRAESGKDFPDLSP